MPAPTVDVASSIITQVTKDGENNNNTVSEKVLDDISLKNNYNKSEKKNEKKKLIQSMLCCFRRPKRKFSKASLQEETSWVPSPSVKIDTVPPPTPSLSNKSEVLDSDSLCTTEQQYLLPSKSEKCIDKKCAIIDLDETLVHSSFQPVSNADFVVPVEIEGTVHQVYVSKRPHVDTYLQRMGELFECVLFTASLSKYADPVADLLDKDKVFSSRLFRESCVFHYGNYVKDLSLIGRDLNEVVIIDNSPASYIFHPDNAIPILSWFDNPDDRELLDLLPFLEEIAQSDDIFSLLQSHGFTSQAKLTTANIQQQLQQYHHLSTNTQQTQNDVIYKVER